MSLLDTTEVQCPWCWETHVLLVDLTAGHQVYTEDCAVCCRPMTVHVVVDGGEAVVSVEAES